MFAEVSIELQVIYFKKIVKRCSDKEQWKLTHPSQGRIAKVLAILSQTKHAPWRFHRQSSRW